MGQPISFSIIPVFFNKLSVYAALIAAQLRSFALIADPAVHLDYPFAQSDIERLHRIGSDPAVPSVDEPSWQGLLLGPYFDALTGQVSIFGKQVLHQRLRNGLDDTARSASGDRVRALMAEPARLDDMTRACLSLRRADAEIATLLFAAALDPVPPWAGRAWLLFVGLAAAVGAVVLTPLAWLGAAFFMYKMIAIQMRYHEHIDVWNRAINSVQMLLRTVSLLGAMEHPLLGQFKATGARAGRINRSLTRSPGSNLIPGARAYADWFLLANVSHYFKGIGLVGRHRDFLRDCFARCANLEADLALARHLLRTPACWAERGGEGVLELEQAVHPLLDRPAALSLALHGKGAFVSGQNGIGKSTLLRTIGLNLLAARAFGFCYAARATVPMLPVYASMQSEDSLLGGESLYIAELERARQLLAIAGGTHNAVFLIDEIFRGTNHLESVSAAAAVLDVLAAGRLVIVSSHNLVLGPLLEHRLAPLCVALDALGSLALKPGLLAQTNGIALLAERGLGAQVEARAAKVFDWLGAYLAQPAGGGEVLGAGSPDVMTTLECDEQR
jgi:hypothetical protein